MAKLLGEQKICVWSKTMYVKDYQITIRFRVAVVYDVMQGTEYVNCVIWSDKSVKFLLGCFRHVGYDSL
jgi:hypothetical protein